MTDQSRWPKGTPVAPGGRGPGGGRFRAIGRDLFAEMGREGVVDWFRANPDELLAQGNGVAMVARVQGFDALPQAGDVDAVIAVGGMEIFRGVRSNQGYVGDLRVQTSGEEYAAAFRTGPAFYGDGIQGSGIYFTTSRDFARDSFSTGLDGGAVIRAALNPDARTITREEVRERLRADWDGSVPEAMHDEGIYAALLGYDAVIIPREGMDQTFVLLLNRSAVTVEPDWADQVSGRLPGKQEAPGARLAALVPVDADPYGMTKPGAVQEWAKENLEYGGPGGVRSQVRSSYVTRQESGRVSLTFSGSFNEEPDDYYKQGREVGNWSFHVVIPPNAPPYVEIDGVGVRYERRGEGIASLWLQRLEDVFSQEGVNQIQLFDISHAHRGTSFWAQHGFRQESDLMVKELL